MPLGEKFKIFPKRKSIFIKEDSGSQRYYFFPELKQFSNKDKIEGFDADFVRYTYRIDPMSLEVQIKTLDLSMGEGVYSFENGVFIQPKITTIRYSDEQIKEFEIQHDWRTPDFISMAPVVFYILFLHPEIVPKDRFVGHLYDIRKKYKDAIDKVESYAKKHIDADLYVKTGEVSTFLEFKDESNKVITTQIWNASKACFNPSSEFYCGLTEEEFRLSHRVLGYVETFLNL